MGKRVDYERYLAAAELRDARRGPSPTTADRIMTFLRIVQDDATTRQIATGCSISIGTARRHLWALQKDSKVEAYDSGASGRMGNEITWSIK